MFFFESIDADNNTNQLRTNWKKGEEGIYTWLTSAVSNGMWDAVDYHLNFRLYKGYGLHYF